ncbi:hypothetical protein GcM3_049029 [Golovinomyces cichoracearum]|uniref:Capsule polysaccharide biosynthesis protein n=1 Tax=Golovinomyces cichoracearum TaxID=62708 RepID=A0A420J005_9PEZI|nr:hypothetical protein GcM3_049029 [Golovinomyces cichoracearum]
MDNMNSTFMNNLIRANVSSHIVSNKLGYIGTALGSEILSPTVVSRIWDICSLWKILFFLLIITNLKCVPFIWHFRILNGISRTIKTQRTKTPINYTQIFQPIITTSHAPLMEIDFMMHKTNSSYFADVDVARAHLLSTLFSTGIEHMRGGTGIFAYRNGAIFTCALASVSCSFRRELKAYEPYELWTRVLSWDEKWIYLITHFVRKGAANPKEFSLYPEQNPGSRAPTEAEGEKLAEQRASMDEMNCHPGVMATALSKCVFKSGRRTVSPAYMLRNSGILLPASGDITSELNEEDSSKMDSIEKIRVRGLESARPLANEAVQALELEFTGENGPVLGRHVDGIGLEGVLRCSYFLTLRTLRSLARYTVSSLLSTGKKNCNQKKTIENTISMSNSLQS